MNGMSARVLALTWLGCLAAGAVAQRGPSAPVREVVLRVPFAEGERQSVWRGPGEKSHSDRFNRYAVDFSPLDEGHRIVSASAGRVVFVKQDTPGPTGNWRDNNEVAVMMPNGKDVVVYLHLVKGGADVKVGDQVLPGDPIGRAGNTGNSEATHLHIDVRKGHRLGPSIPWRFSVLEDKKPIRAGMTLRSQNVGIRERLEPLWSLHRATQLSEALERPTLVARYFRELRKQKTKGWSPWELAEREELLEGYERRAANWLARLDKVPLKDRAALACTIRDAFAGTEAAEGAEDVLRSMPEDAVRAGKKLAQDRKQDVARLQKALDLEHKAWRTSRKKRRRALDKAKAAFERAAKDGPEERAALVRKHVRAL